VKLSGCLLPTAFATSEHCYLSYQTLTDASMPAYENEYDDLFSVHF
jgi:hypothetical protein